MSPFNTPAAWDEFWSEQGETPPTQGAGTWERLTWEMSFEFWEEFFNDQAPGRSLLECGCGSAQVSAHFAQSGYECTLVDYSETALDLARRRFKSAGVEANFIRADVTRTPFPDAQFDIIFSGGLLEFFADVCLPIREMARILKPGGILAASMVPNKWSVQTFGNVEQTVLRCIKRLGSGRFHQAFEAVRTVPANYGVYLHSLTHYREACTHAGLKEITATGVTPFPSFALPNPLRNAYICLMALSRPAWKRFDRSRSRWTEWWGIAYRLHARKPYESATDGSFSSHT